MAEQDTYQLYYFPFMGRAEGLRLLLSEAGVEWENKYVQFKEFPALKPKLPFGSLPVLEINNDGVYRPQSFALCRLVADRHGLYGNNADERYAIDLVMEGTRDIREAQMSTLKFKGGNQQKKEKYLNEVLPRRLGEWDALMEKSENGWIANGSFSVADIFLADTMETVNNGVPNVLDNHPKLKEHMERVFARPNIAAYRASDKKKGSYDPLPTYDE